MTKAVTEKVEKSENNKIASGIDREFFRLYCEDHDELRKSVEDMLRVRETTKDERVRVDIDKWIVEQLIGKSKQSTELESLGGIEIIVNSGTLDNGENKDQS